MKANKANKANKRMVVTVLVVGWLWLALARGVSAAASISISPPLLEAVVKPGRTITQAYQVANSGQTDLYLRTKVVPFIPAGEKGGVRLEDFGGAGGRFSGWFGLQNSDLGLGETFFLPAGDSRQLVLKITVPPTAAAETDGYFTFLLEQSSKGKFIGPGRAGSGALIKIGSNILLTVSRDDNLEFKGAVARFAARPSWGDVFSPVKFLLVAENRGGSFFKTRGEIKIFDMLGREKGRLDLRPDNVLAGSRRQLVCLPARHRKRSGVAGGPGCSFSSLIPGRYRAVAEFKPEGLLEGGGGAASPAAVTAAVYFWLLPLKLGFVLLLAGVIILVIGKRERLVTGKR